MFKKIITIPDGQLLKVYDDTPLWSAPFGLTLLDTVKYKKNINILDVCSGCGFPMLDAAMRFGTICKVYGIEIWEAGVNKTREKISVLNLSNAEIIHGNAQELPFEDEYFGLIISNNGLNNVEDVEKVLSECYRTLKPGGQFTFTFNLPDTMYEFYNEFKQVLEENNMKDELRKVDLHIREKRKTPGEMFDLLCKYKFVVNSSLSYSFGYKFTDAESMINYFIIRDSFLPVWLEILKEDDREKIFTEISKRLNEKYDTTTLTIPYTCFDCEK